jgi:electron transfer flavoprotein alpha subunit
MLGKARSLSQKNGAEVICLDFGSDDSYVDELFYHGADNIIQCSCRSDDYTVYAKIAERLIATYLPKLVLFPGTPLGKAVAAYAATTTASGLVADCIEIELSNDGYVFSRAALSSSAIASIVCTEGVQMCTVKPNIFIPYVKRIKTRRKKAQQYRCGVESSFSGFVELLGTKQRDDLQQGNLEKARAIFSVGRGVSDEDSELIRMLARYFGAQVGGTRIMVENGKLPKSSQIGQSGVTVAPELYVAFGISGANQHIVGIRNARKIIAVNIDKDAPIFQYADYAIVSDVHIVVKQLIEKTGAVYARIPVEA